MPTILNAANEIAVAAFLEGTIGFPQIHTVNARTVDGLAGTLGHTDNSADLESLLALDARARTRASAFVKDLAR